MLKIAVVENEKECANALVEFAQKWSEESKEEVSVRVFDNAVDFISDYRSDIDAVFMDIMMPHMDGMSAAEKLRETDKKVSIIFVTNMAQFALQGYKVGALDYLVKPVGYFDFSLELQKLSNIKKQNETSFLFLNIGGTLRRVAQSDISYIEIISHYVVVHAGGEELSFRGSLKEIENKLEKKMFSRCNNCYIINLSRVTEMRGDEVRLDTGEKIPVSRPRKGQVMNDLAAYIAEVVRGGCD